MIRLPPSATRTYTLVPVTSLFRSIAVGGGQQADVHLDRLAAADTVDLALLDGAQQLGLQARMHFGDFVEQQGAAVGLLELAAAARHRSGEGALFVAAQLGLQQATGVLPPVLVSNATAAVPGLG